MTRPSLGRIVHYNEAGSIYAALVVHVHMEGKLRDMDVVNIVFWDGLGVQHSKALVPFCSDILADAGEDGHWHWPPRMP